MDIYTILASKPHNLHYLNRYVSFIERCHYKNVGHNGYTEHHHICPKADDMFPEYTCLKRNPWNGIKLSARQHFIAHLLLWKAFPQITSPLVSFWQMKHKNKIKINSRIYESLKIEFAKKNSERMKDTTVVKDKEGNKFRVPVDDPGLKSGELAGIAKGTVVVKDKEGNKFRVPVDDPGIDDGTYVMLTTGNIGVKDTHGNTMRVSINDPRYLSGELVAITTGMTWKIEDTSNYKKPKSPAHIINMKKYASVTDPETMETKRVLRTDPLYISGYYRGPAYGAIKTEKQKLDISKRFKGVKKKRCCCLSCGKEVSANNLNRHYLSVGCRRGSTLSS